MTKNRAEHGASRATHCYVPNEHILIKMKRMDLDEYNRRMTLIHEELADIAKRTENQAWAKPADYSNPRFVTLMQRHTKLTRVSSELTVWMMAQVGLE